MPVQVTFTNPFFKRMMFTTRVNAHVESALQDLLARKNANESMALLSDATKQFIAASPFAMKLTKLRNAGNPSTKYDLSPLDFSTADYKTLKRYISSARIRVPLKVQNTISMVINNVASEFLSALHSATQMQKLATLSVLNDPALQATLFGHRFESIPAYRCARKTQMAYPASDENSAVMDHIKGTLQRAYKHTHSATTVRGAKMEDSLLHIVAYALCVSIYRYADVLTHMNSATPNKTVRNGDVHRMFEMDGILNDYNYVEHFKPQIKVVDAADSSPEHSAAAVAAVADVSAAPAVVADAPPDLPEPASAAAAAVSVAADDSAAASASAAGDKRRRKPAKK
jgi:hypothetical protein